MNTAPVLLTCCDVIFSLSVSYNFCVYFQFRTSCVRNSICIWSLYFFLHYTLLNNVNLKNLTNIAMSNIITPDADEGVDEPNKFTS